MSSKRKRKLATPDVDVTAFSDMAFLLIIFFVLTTTFAQPIGRLIDVPSAANPEDKMQATEDKTPLVSITVDRIMLGEGDNEGREVTLTELRHDMLQRKFSTLPADKRMVVVQMSDEVAYQRYYETIAMIADCGGIIALVEAE